MGRRQRTWSAIVTMAIVALAMAATIAGWPATAMNVLPVSGDMAITDMAAHPGAFNSRNGSTVIDYAVTNGSGGQASLGIYGPDRRRVGMIYGGTVGSGRGSIAWDGKNGTGIPLSEGRYVANLSVTVQGNASQTPRFLLEAEHRATEEYFNLARGVAVDGAGNIFVADTFNDRILKYDPSGRQVAGWGAHGEGPGQFNLPFAIAIDENGLVNVLDTANDRVQKFDSEGRYVSEWGRRGTGAGQMYHPYGFAFDGLGHVYVADLASNRIDKFDTEGNFLTMWEHPSGNVKENFHPYSVAADREGNVYVPDIGVRQILKFNSSGGQIARWTNQPVTDQRDSNPIAVDRAGNVYLAADRSYIKKYDPDGRELAVWSGPGYEDVHFNDPWGIDIDDAGNVYVADGRAVLKFDPSGRLVMRLPVQRDPRLFVPESVATDSAGNMYVADTGNSRVQKFDAGGTFLAMWGGPGNSPGLFNGPRGIATDIGDNVYVADTGNHRVQKFDGGGRLIATWGGYGSDPGHFDSPTDIAVDDRCHVYVADFNNYRIQKFDAGGRFLSALGGKGSGEGQFRYPWYVAVDGASNLYVMDVGYGTQTFSAGSAGVQGWGEDRIQKFDPEGRFILSWRSMGSDSGLLEYRQGIAADLFGNVYAVDPLRDRVLKFNGTGALLSVWGGHGNGTGRFDMPYGIAADRAGNIYVADTANRKVQKFARPWTAAYAETGILIDNTPPEVVSVRPARNATGVPVAAAIVVTFSEPVNTSRVTIANFSVRDDKGSAIAGSVSAQGRNVTFMPHDCLYPETRYTATISGISDLAGNQLPAAYTWLFVTENLPPEVTSVTVPDHPVSAGTTVTMNGTYHDPGRGSHAAVWDWGDNATSKGTVTRDGPDGTVRGNHSYAVPGLYTATLTVTDSGCAAGSGSSGPVAVFDPGSIATGGGWLNYTAAGGAYSPGLSRAALWFSSRYGHGSTVPAGEVRVVANDMDFRSTSQDWLIVRGDEALIEGGGTVNGMGNYRFAIAAACDRPGVRGNCMARIKIWSGDGKREQVVFDTSPGDPITAPPVTSLRGGAIIRSGGKENTEAPDIGMSP